MKRLHLALILFWSLVSFQVIAAPFPPPPLRASACIGAYNYNEIPRPVVSSFLQRIRLINQAREPVDTHEWLMTLAEDGDRLLYSRRNFYLPGNEFVLSNEFDWQSTPLDGAKSDIMVAFGTNSAWEIAADRDVTDLVLADVSPFPILGHALLIEPFMRISQTPADLIQLLAGQPLNAEKRSIDDLFEKYGKNETLTLSHEQIKGFLYWLALQTNIRDTELQFISSYFWRREPGRTYRDGPLHGVRNALFTHLVQFLQERYEGKTPESLEKSVLHNQKLFDRLKRVYDGHVRYAFTDVGDLEFYKTLLGRYSQAKRWSLSITNIFDMSYSQHSERTLPAFLANLLTGLKSDGQDRQLSVFRTKRYEPPFDFVRYDLDTRRGLVGDLGSLEQRQ